MKQLFYIISVLLLAGATPMQAQTKTKAKSTTQAKAKTGTAKTSAAKASSSKILYVEPEDRNYAQNLGGHMFWDYTAREGNALLTDWKISKEDYKKLVEKYTYKTFE